MNYKYYVYVSPGNIKYFDDYEMALFFAALYNSQVKLIK